ncbi:MAG: hypothetical protein AB7S49_13000 [Arcobacter sp.]|jgi:heme/copper-type cytochrome/quinol oxidase subunit 2|uniref:hypothetical protein n=1 Tax=Arcobacter sp. TaxID=1872629 RepID=UPI003D0381BA
MKKIKINELIFGIICFIIFICFFATFFTAIIAIFFGEVPTKTSGIVKYSFSDSINILFVAIFTAISGFFFIKFFEPKKTLKNKPKHPQYTKCPKCKEVFNYKELINGKCKNCKDVDTVDLEEYFEKYPDELKEKEKNVNKKEQ